MKLIHLAVAILIIGASTLSHSQSDENIYQVEVIVFERINRRDSNDNEEWSKLINLQYPDKWVRLLSKDEAAQIIANAGQEQADFSLSDDFLKSFGDQSTTPPPVAQNASQTSPQSPPDNKAGFYRFLPDSMKSLKDSRRALDRAGNLRTLFHETWYQPMQNADKAPGLLIRAGNMYDDHAELEGYITLSLSRYLHIQTNLWFTQFVPNYGQLSDHWPPLPQFPSAAISSATAAKTEIETELNTNNQPLLTTNGLDDSLQDKALQFDNYGDTAGFKSEYDEPIDKPYMIKETVVLDQKRRMRSRELHYIDHPRLGLLIIFKPLEKSESDS